MNTKTQSHRIRALWSLLGLVTLCTLPGIAAASDVDELLAQGKFCSATAQAAFRACGNDVLDNYWIAVGICINESDGNDRRDCLQEAKDARSEENQSCSGQLEARHEACTDLGEHRYDPPFEPALFEKNFANLANPNRYFPLEIRSHWVFKSADQLTNVTILNETKLIDEVRCVVSLDEVRDLHTGELIESTND